MRNDVAVHEEAAIEYDQAFDWYLQRNPEAARKFDAEVERAFSEIAKSPQRWASGPHSTRKFLLRQFPFIIIYRERVWGEIQIIAIAHTSRKPFYWKQRI